MFWNVVVAESVPLTLYALIVASCDETDKPPYFRSPVTAIDPMTLVFTALPVVKVTP